MKKMLQQLELNSIPKFWFKSTDTLFDCFKNSTLDYDNPKKRRVFIDNGGSVLLVAHLDTVQIPKIIGFSADRIWATGLDDRLGAFIAYKLSTMLGCDLLLCDLEESGQSTAQYHKMKNKYNWVCEFDRAGDDVVTYDLESEKFQDILDDTWAVGFGSFSDICFLDTDVCCFNLGIGYEKAHALDSYAVLSTMNEQVKLWIDFYNQYKDTRFEYDGDNLDKRQRDYGFGNYNYYNKDYDVDWKCEICYLEYGEDIFGHTICENCFSYMFRQMIGV